MTTMVTSAPSVGQTVVVRSRAFVITDKVGRSIHGATCHACLFAPETSCERGNRYLDRSVLVSTLLAKDTEFFKNV